MALSQADQDLIAKDCVTGSQIAVIKECLEQKKTDIYNRIIAYLGGGYWMFQDGTYWDRISDISDAYYHTFSHPQWVVDRMQELIRSYNGNYSQIYNINNRGDQNVYVHPPLSAFALRFRFNDYYSMLYDVYASYWRIPEIEHIMPQDFNYEQLNLQFFEGTKVFHKLLWNLVPVVGTIISAARTTDAYKNRSPINVHCSETNKANQNNCQGNKNSIASYAPQLTERRANIVALAQAWHDTDELIDAVNSGEVDAFNQGLSPEQAQAIADARLKAAVAKQKALAKSIGAGADSMDAKTKQRKLIITGVILLIATAVVIALAKQLSKNK